MSDQTGPAGLTDKDRHALNVIHHPDDGPGNWCACGFGWPCLTRRLLDAYDAALARAEAAEAENRGMTGELRARVDEINILGGQVDDLQGALDRQQRRAEDAEARVERLGVAITHAIEVLDALEGIRWMKREMADLKNDVRAVRVQLQAALSADAGREVGDDR